MINDEDKIELLFSDLSENDKMVLCSIPQHVSVTKNPDEETLDQIANTQDKFINLPLNAKRKLASSETGILVQKIGESFNLQLLQLSDISRVIRSYYFGEIKLEDFPNVLAREIPTNIDVAREISRQIIERIIKNESLGSDENLVDVSLGQAFQQYPNIGEQLITSSPIKLKLFPQPVRPSIKNWIEDYRQTMGVQKQGMMERGNYLFHSENGKKLTSGERKKIAEILRSLDEGVTLKIDPERQEVVFEQPEAGETKQEEERPRTNIRQTVEPKKEIVNKSFERFASEYQEKNSQNIPSTRPQAPNSNIRFSSPHIMQSERVERKSMNQGNFRQSPIQEKPKKAPIYQAPPAIQRNFTASNQPRIISKYQSNAGKPFEDDDVSVRPNLTEPKISGNVVDLKN